MLDGIRRQLPIVASLSEALVVSDTPPEYCVVGIATHGGHFAPELRALLLEAAHAGLSIVNGLHDCASDDPAIVVATAG